MWWGTNRIDHRGLATKTDAVRGAHRILRMTIRPGLSCKPVSLLEQRRRIETMNLLDRWIPVRRRSGNKEIIAPWQIAVRDDPAVAILTPRADFTGALYQMLIGMVQTLFAPEDHFRSGKPCGKTCRRRKRSKALSMRNGTLSRSTAMALPSCRIMTCPMSKAKRLPRC
jgi:CRISPR-associated protein Cse1 (CRISPR_cse1)